MKNEQLKCDMVTLFKFHTFLFGLGDRPTSISKNVEGVELPINIGGRSEHVASLNRRYVNIRKIPFIVTVKHLL